MHPAPLPPAYAAAPPRTNTLAVVTLVLGVLGFALLPVVLGHLALAQVRRTGERGAALAVVGLVLGYLTCALYALVAVLVLGGGIVLWGAG
ncbi:DUF4190 domain-containing protein [Cellulomonas oligotrophica]|uniref:DUF4190 domain-containing protein n=1 Tax=Cellulomonas oligotrophica TaxID=931536 RepID=A0A7Y9JYT2_9CELL|nr:DUF4190 domain-containing protein [Cellulomonas oligotrophica]NYD86074.1 hypothetical protein [Cellulomonas oligotrophica]GIG30919.1 hypothetical protein Col01nite_00780 [Cellulomonas oligotrophica]